MKTTNQYHNDYLQQVRLLARSDIEQHNRGVVVNQKRAKNQQLQINIFRLEVNQNV